MWKHFIRVKTQQIWEPFSVITGLIPLEIFKLLQTNSVYCKQNKKKGLIAIIRMEILEFFCQLFTFAKRIHNQ
jgi:hypothetical protein